MTTHKSTPSLEEPLELFTPASGPDCHQSMNPINHRPVGRRIFTLRKRQRITQTDLAAWLRALPVPISRDIVANWETGRVAVPAYCIQLLAYSLGVRIADLLPNLTIKGVIDGQIAPCSISRRRNRGPRDH